MPCPQPIEQNAKRSAWAIERTPDPTRAQVLTYEAAVDLLLRLVRYPPRPYQERPDIPGAPITRLLARLGNPHLGTKLIHVAGSKGKGSTVLLAEAILRQAGYRTGTFTSPHLQRWTERFRIGGEESSPAEFCHLIEQLRPHIEAMCLEGTHAEPGFFDALTAGAFIQFKDAHCDIGLLETGLGGRLDPTNVATPTVSCITSIELEHTDKLGTSISAIAREKAGIIKPGVPVVLGKLDREARNVVLELAQQQHAPVYELGRDITLTQMRLDAFSQQVQIDFHGLSVHATLAQPGLHAAENAALAVACVQLYNQDPAQTEAATQRAFPNVRLPGRFERLAIEPMVIADVAHTVSSMRALSEQLQQLEAKERHFVVSVTHGKDAYELLKPIESIAACITVTNADPQRSQCASEVARTLRERGFSTPLVVEPSPVKALLLAHAAIGAADLLCVSGSVYIAGLARTVLGTDSSKSG